MTEGNLFLLAGELAEQCCKISALSMLAKARGHEDQSRDLASMIAASITSISIGDRVCMEEALKALTKVLTTAGIIDG